MLWPIEEQSQDLGISIIDFLNLKLADCREQQAQQKHNLRKLLMKKAWSLK